MEYSISIVLEFGGLLVFALMTTLITPLVEPEQDFEMLLIQRLDEMNLWVKRLQQAKSNK